MKKTALTGKKSLVCGKQVRLPDPKDDYQTIIYVANWLLFKQREPSLRVGFQDLPTCTIRGVSKDQPVACGVGCLIPDDDYKPSMEGTGVSLEVSSPTKDYLEAAGFSIPMAIRLQSIHDSCLATDWTGIESWWRSLVRMTYVLGFGNDDQKMKDVAFEILNFKLSGIDEDDVFRLAKECQRLR